MHWSGAKQVEHRRPRGKDSSCRQPGRNMLAARVVAGKCRATSPRISTGVSSGCRSMKGREPHSGRLPCQHRGLSLGARIAIHRPVGRRFRVSKKRWRLNSEPKE
jgi:hypothetical protein